MRARLLLLLLFSEIPLNAQKMDSSFILTSAGKHFQAGPAFRLFFGTHWRETWSQQVSVPRLYLSDSLTVEATKEIGHVISLILRHSNGTRYLVRPVTRDVRYMLPEELRETVAREIIDDQISVANPYATLITDRLERTLGLREKSLQFIGLSPEDLPDSLRATFAEIPASVEVFDENGTISSDSLFRRLESFPEESVDELAYLKHRLFDMLVGEWDRSPAEWRWKQIVDGPLRRWIPRPTPRDRAFSRFDGLLPSLMQLGVQKLSHVSDAYGNIDNLTQTARNLDRTILISHEKQIWDSLTAWMKSSLTDSVIEAAVHSLPHEAYLIDGLELSRTLRDRRNELDKASKELYKLCSEFIEINTIARGERVRLRRAGTHLLFLERSYTDSIPRRIFSRRFSDDYTKEIRLFLSKGGNTVQFDGADQSEIRIIVVAGTADTLLENESARGGQFANPFQATSTLVYGAPYTKIGRKEPMISLLPAMEGIPSSEYGSAWKFVPWVGSSPDEGLFLGGGVKFERYGFRRFPYELSHQLRLGIATLPGRFRADWTGEFYAPLDPAKLLLYVMASQVEVQNFFGLGNESAFNESLARARFYKVEQNELSFRVTVDSKVEASTHMLLGAGIKIVDNSLPSNTLIDSLKPYGSAKNFALGSVGVQFLHDSRNDLLYPSSGWYGVAEFGYYPDWFTSKNSFIRTKAELRSYIPVSSGVLALRGTFESISGAHPFFESAIVGGPNSLRGYEVQRFTGDAAVFGSGELRFPVAQYMVLVPQWFGVSTFAEAGRVFEEGENSSTIHTAVGAGVWFSFIKREYVGAFSIAVSNEKIFFYGSLGFAF
jgi:hypothetical protein